MSTTATSRRLDGLTASPDQVVSARVIGAQLFKGALIRERKRADRSSRSLAVALISLNEPAASRLSTSWRRVVDALAAAKRETDILGWFEPRMTVGVIVPEIASAGDGFVKDFSERLRLELGRRLDAQTLQCLTVRLHIHPALAGPAVDDVEPIEPLLIDATRRPTYDLVKRGLDVAGSLTLLILLSPLFLLIAALVKLSSSGPVLFRQTRVGQMRKTFTCLKFRTMQADADHGIHQEFVSSYIKSGARAQEAAKKGVFKITDDPRVTTTGRILRKTSLDELPQLWNVLRGDMSLVGPRPPVPYEVEQYQAWHCRRVLEAKPGITGLWQVNGRSRTTFDEMVRLDLQYAKACSLWTDLKILLATPKAVIAGKGAW
jgi:exopolysaccharide biosynthesis polyprenyl glycosylphosphotransferase